MATPNPNESATPLGEYAAAVPDERAPLSPGEPASRKNDLSPPRYYVPRRFMVTLMAFLGSNMSYIIRVSTSTTITPMQNAENWDIRQCAHVLAAFYVGYLVTVTLGGFFAQKIGGKKALLLCSFCAAICTALIPLAVSHFWLVVFLRFLTGVFSGPSFPALTHASVIMGGSTVGTIFVFFVSPLLISSGLGWQAVFYLHAVIVFVWCLLWLILVNRSAEHSKGNRLKPVRIHDSELAYIRSGLSEAPSQSEGFPWRKLFALPFLALFGTWFCNSWGQYLMLNWLPTYFTSLNFSSQKQSLLLSGGYTASFVIALVSGFLADASIARGASVTIVRRVSGFVSTGSAVLFTWLVVAKVLTGEYLMIGVAMLGINFAISGLSSTPNMLDLAPSRAAMIMSICGLLAAVPAIISIELAGQILSTSYGWTGVFATSATSFSVSLVLWVLFASGKAQI